MITPELAFMVKVGWADRDDYTRARKAILAMRRKRLEKDAPFCPCGTQMTLSQEMSFVYCDRCYRHDGLLIEWKDGKAVHTGTKL